MRTFLKRRFSREGTTISVYSLGMPRGCLVLITLHFFNFFFIVICLLDYDAPLSEAGDITEKFKELKEVMKKYSPDANEPSTMKFF